MSARYVEVTASESTTIRAAIKTKLGYPLPAVWIPGPPRGWPGAPPPAEEPLCPIQGETGTHLLPLEADHMAAVAQSGIAGPLKAKVASAKASPPVTFIPKGAIPTDGPVGASKKR